MSKIGLPDSALFEPVGVPKSYLWKKSFIGRIILSNYYRRLPCNVLPFPRYTSFHSVCQSKARILFKHLGAPPIFNSPRSSTPTEFISGQTWIFGNSKKSYIRRVRCLFERIMAGASSRCKISDLFFHIFHWWKRRLAWL